MWFLGCSIPCDVWFPTQLYDATGGKMKLLMIRACEPSVNSWMKGEFLDNLMLVAWSREDGRAFVYKLSAQ